MHQQRRWRSPLDRSLADWSESVRTNSSSSASMVRRQGFRFPIAALAQEMTLDSRRSTSAEKCRSDMPETPAAAIGATAFRRRCPARVSRKLHNGCLATGLHRPGIARRCVFGSLADLSDPSKRKISRRSTNHTNRSRFNWSRNRYGGRPASPERMRSARCSSIKRCPCRQTGSPLR